ncbi:dihydroorotase [Candidatus Aerophobetes bacterium]|uniref:Dihydroorotase n=1 Tax=Aerophobetes bacterium TaxID=2030807 RepID=A0A2A4YEG3_UNCAE|nr:MAG: dihydroorotase [Candidatus Aerophobetes bacterium]
MIILKNVSSITGEVFDYEIASDETHIIDAKGLTLLPGLIDPHVHFRTPGHQYKENWISASKAALFGGFTTVFDMPNTNPATVTCQRLKEKKELIESQLKESGFPLRYHLYFGVDKKHFDEIEKVKKHTIALKIFMGTSTGDLLMDDDSSLHAAFALASAHDLLVCVHAEDEAMIEENTKKYLGSKDFKTHSMIRTPEVARSAAKQAIDLAQLYNTRLHILHVSSKEEIDCIREAKKKGIQVTCETTPHHLFLNTDSYETLKGQAQVNPSLKEKQHQKYLFEAIKDGVIDTIGSDHAPHTKEEKAQEYGETPSGMPGVETTLPLLLTAASENKLNIDDIVRLCSTRIQEIYRLAPNDDVILVDLEMKKTVDDSHLNTKCGWSPYSGTQLKGWPVYAVMKGVLYNLREGAIC